jgi:hypothetical protein
VGEPYRQPSAPPEEAAPPPPPRDEGVRLGARRSRHPRPSLARSLGTAHIAASCLFVVIGATLTLSLHDNVPMLLLGSLAAFDMARRAAMHSRARGLVVDLHDAGLVVTVAKLRDVVFFEDIDEVWMRITRERRFAIVRALRLIDRSGKTHVVPLAVDDAAAIARAVVLAASHPLYDDARSALAAGQTLTFGEHRLDGEGIALVGRRGRTRWRIPWSELRLVRRAPGRVSLVRHRTIAWRVPAEVRVDLSRVPHPTLFARLVSERAEEVEGDEPLSFTAG